MRDQVSLLMQTQGCALGPCDFRGIKTSWKMCVQARWTRATETDRDTNTETHTRTHTHRLTQANTQADTLQKTPAHTHTQKDTHTHTHRYAHCTDWHICAQTSGNCRQRQRAWESQRKRERERETEQSQNYMNLHQIKASIPRNYLSGIISSWWANLRDIRRNSGLPLRHALHWIELVTVSAIVWQDILDGSWSR